MSAADRQSLAVCGLPRSGTTWLHNALIASGRFAGIAADDLSTEPSPPFATDENGDLHRLLFEVETRQTNDHTAIERHLAAARNRWSRSDLLNKSPYFCFFLDNLYRAGVARKILFLKREIDAVAASMMRHPHIKNLLSGDYAHAFDFATAGHNVEVTHVRSDILRQVERSYGTLGTFDRALFKCLCFTSSFLVKSQSCARDDVLIVEFDRFDEPRQQRALAAFAELTGAEAHTIASLFSRPAGIDALPPHSAAFRGMVLAEIDDLWSRRP